MDGKTSKTLDYGILFALPLLATCLVSSFQLNYLSSVLLFYAVPTLWLIPKTQGVIRAFCFSVSVSIPYAIVLDITGLSNGSWNVPSTSFSERFLNIVPYEDFLWLLLSMFLILCFYLSFVNREAGSRPLLTKRFGIFLILASTICFFVSTTEGGLLRIPYAYFIWVGGLLFIPTLLMFFSLPDRRHILRSSVPVIVYYFFTTLLFEITGTTLNHWNFPGQYVLGSVPLFGNPIPMEELLFVILGGAIGTITFYRFLTTSREKA